MVEADEFYQEEPDSERVIELLREALSKSLIENQSLKELKQRIEKAFEYRDKSIKRQKLDKTTISPWEQSEHQLLQQLLGEVKP